MVADRGKRVIKYLVDHRPFRIIFQLVHAARLGELCQHVGVVIADNDSSSVDCGFRESLKASVIPFCGLEHHVCHAEPRIGIFAFVCLVVLQVGCHQSAILELELDDPVDLGHFLRLENVHGFALDFDFGVFERPGDLSTVVQRAGLEVDHDVEGAQSSLRGDLLQTAVVGRRVVDEGVCDGPEYLCVGSGLHFSSIQVAGQLSLRIESNRTDAREDSEVERLVYQFQ